MTELEELDFQIQQTSLLLDITRDRYHFAVTSGSIESRTEILNRCRYLESKIDELRHKRELIEGVAT